MSERFTAPPPALVDYGFTAGALRIAWSRGGDVAFEAVGAHGVLRIATITEVQTVRAMLKRDDVAKALCGLVVRAPDGELSRITGVESHCTMHHSAGAVLGILLVPVEEP